MPRTSEARKYLFKCKTMSEYRNLHQTIRRDIGKVLVGTSLHWNQTVCRGQSEVHACYRPHARLSRQQPDCCYQNAALKYWSPKLESTCPCHKAFWWKWRGCSSRLDVPLPHVHKTQGAKARKPCQAKREMEACWRHGLRGSLHIIRS